MKGDKKNKKIEKGKSIDTKKLREMIRESAETIAEGAKEVGDISSDVYEKVSDFYDSKIIPAAKNIYQNGAETVEQVVDKIQDTLEKYKDELDVKKLNDQRDKKASDFGMKVYREYMIQNTVTKKFFEKKEISALISEVHEKEVEILKLREKLKKEKK